jgi:hypothetical protein
MTVRRWAFLAALLLLLAQIVAAPSAQAAVYPCLGAPADEPNGGLYPEPRIFLENQAWWQPTVFGTENHGHIHTAACFPRTTYADGSPVKVSGAMPVAIRTILHDNPGLLRYARVHLTTDKSNHAGAFRDDIGENCVEGGPHWNQATLGCVWWSTGTINTAISEFDGYQEMRFSGNVLHANSGTSDTAFSSGGWQVYLSNGKPVQHYRSDASGAPVPWTEGRGWYLGANYTNARLESPIPFEVSGVWSPRVALVRGASGIDPTHGFVSVDPDFHHGSAGMVLFDGAAPTTRTVTLDTTTLTNGLHKLFLRTDAPCDGTAGNNCGLKADGSWNNVSTNSGALVVPFVVANPAA